MAKRKLFYLYHHPSDIMEDIVIFPNCLQPIQYGKLINNTGHVACPDCYDTLAKNIADIRKHN